MNQIALLANGEILSHPTPIHALQTANSIVCCDGAINKLRPEWIAPDCSEIFIVGDGDSWGKKNTIQDLFHNVQLHFVHISEQDDNDLTKAFHFILQHFDLQQIKCITLLGTTGLRDDHSLANISLLGLYYKELITLHHTSITLTMPTNYGIFTPVFGQATLQSHPGQQVSLFSLTPNTPITVKRLKYPIEHRQLTMLWQGSLNEAINDDFEVSGGLLLIYQAF